MTSTTTTPRTLAPLDPLARAIQKVLRTDPPEAGAASGDAQFSPHAYAAAEAYFYLAALDGREVQPVRVADEPVPRWFLRDERGRVIDLALGRRDRANGSGVAYDEGVRRGFRWTQNGPSGRARHIIERVQPGATEQILAGRRERQRD